MTEKPKLSDDLNDFEKWWGTVGLRITGDKFKSVAQAAWLAARESQWIKCEDELPKTDGGYLTVSVVGNIETVFFHSPFHSPYWRSSHGITHWQPLPEGPK